MAVVRVSFLLLSESEFEKSEEFTADGTKELAVGAAVSDVVVDGVLFSISIPFV